jgi:hypothetical protein
LQIKKSKIYTNLHDAVFTNSTFPQAPIFSPIIMTAPSIPSVFSANVNPTEISEALKTLFPSAVAQASAKVVDFAITIAASARPKLREWPSDPEDVQTPQGIWDASIFNAIFPVNGEFPA